MDLKFYQGCTWPFGNGFSNPTGSTDPFHRDFGPVQKLPTPGGRAGLAYDISDTPSIVTLGTKGPAGDTVGFFCTERIPGGWEVGSRHDGWTAFVLPRAP